MRKIFSLFILIFIFFILEQTIFNVFGKGLLPNFLLILIIFFDLSFGIRFSLLTAFMAGVIKDSFSTNAFGLNILSFAATALMVTFFRNYWYRKGSEISRLLLVVVAVSTNLLCQYFLRLMHAKIGLFDVLAHVYLPELFLTMLVSLSTINILRRCVSKLFAW